MFLASKVIDIEFVRIEKGLPFDLRQTLYSLNQTARVYSFQYLST